MARVVLDHLTKDFPVPGRPPVRAVADLSLDVRDKELLVLVGPSGCGKTTTLRLIAGLEEPTAGTIAIDDRIVNQVPPKDRDIEMVFQNYALYPHMTVAENFAFGLKLRKVSSTEIQRRIMHAATILGLAPALDRKPAELSGGERQRVALGRALVRQPKVFLFDEPLSNLDATLRRQMRAEISRLHRQLAATIIYVTHDQLEALTLGQRIAVLSQGVLQQVADPMTLYRNPVNLFVAGFIGSPPMNFFHGSLVAKGDTLFFQEQPAKTPTAPNPINVRFADPAPPAPRSYIGKSVILGLRPEDISHQINSVSASTQGTIRAIVELVQPMGSETYVHLAGAAHPFIARLPASDPIHVNQTLPLLFNMSHAHFFDPATETAIV
jgi:multiple sugar transport system ATP-binding protein